MPFSLAAIETHREESASQPAGSPTLWNTFDEAVGRPMDFLEKNIPLVQNLGGSARTRHYLRFHSLGPVHLEKAVAGKRIEDTYEFRNDIRFESDLALRNLATGKASMDIQMDYGVNRDDFRPEEHTFKLFEGYGDFKWKTWDLRVGRQVIRWGRADEVNPVDNFTPENFKEYVNFDRADRKWPVLAAYLKQFFTDRISWEGIWIPFFSENLIAESEQD